MRLAMAADQLLPGILLTVEDALTSCAVAATTLPAHMSMQHCFRCQEYPRLQMVCGHASVPSAAAPQCKDSCPLLIVLTSCLLQPAHQR